MSQSGEDCHGIDANNGLLVYYHGYSYYSQKVIMALHEKNLQFQTHAVSLVKMEQYSPWYLKLNPRGEVPTLQDTGKIIPDSSRIIDYLEDNFSNGGTPRLIPTDQGTEIRQKVTQFRSLIDQLPADVITIGSFVHSGRVGFAKPPFVGPVRRLLANNNRDSPRFLRECAEKYPEHKEVLMKKATETEQKSSRIRNEAEYFQVLDQVGEVLDKVEEELLLHTDDKKDWWLCTDRFTIADVALTILLERLNQLGYDSYYWKNGKRTELEKYYARVKQRDSYKKTIPGMLFHIQQFLDVYRKPLILGIGVVTAVAIIVGSVFLLKN